MLFTQWKGSQWFPNRNRDKAPTTGNYFVTVTTNDISFATDCNQLRQFATDHKLTDHFADTPPWQLEFGCLSKVIGETHSRFVISS